MWVSETTPNRLHLEEPLLSIKNRSEHRPDAGSVGDYSLGGSGE